MTTELRLRFESFGTSKAGFDYVLFSAVSNPAKQISMTVPASEAEAVRSLTAGQIVVVEAYDTDDGCPTAMGLAKVVEVTRVE